jgi:hypothetical protein
MAARLILAGVGLIGVVGLGACSSEQSPADPAVETMGAPPASAAGAAAAVIPASLNASDLRRVCQAVLASVHAQPIADIRIDGLEGEVVNASWRAPVDGGRRTAQCRVEGDLATWRPTGLPTAEANRWMNQATDPAIRFTIDGDVVTVTQTLPDGTSTSSEVTVPAQEEAR